MRIYIITLKTVGYDEYDSICVIADDAKTARIAAKEWVDDKGGSWYSDEFLDPAGSTLKLIKANGPVVALASFNRG